MVVNQPNGHLNRLKVDFESARALLVPFLCEVISIGEQHGSAKYHDGVANSEVAPVVVVAVLLAPALRAAWADANCVRLQAGNELMLKVVIAR